MDEQHPEIVWLCIGSVKTSDSFEDTVVMWFPANLPSQVLCFDIDNNTQICLFALKTKQEEAELAKLIEAQNIKQDDNVIQEELDDMQV